jgi:hypothetical protein
LDKIVDERFYNNIVRLDEIGPETTFKVLMKVLMEVLTKVLLKGLPLWVIKAMLSGLMRLVQREPCQFL